MRSAASSREIVDLFAGAGGWDEGLRDLGFSAMGIDADALACETAEAAGHDRLVEDIADLDPTDLAPIWGLIASPPCQAYSTSGKKLGRLDKDAVIACAHEIEIGGDTRTERAAECRDGRSLLSVEPLRWTIALKPRWVAFEQVPAVLELWSHFASLLALHGYEAAVGGISAERFGVPQTRRRAFLIASLDGPVHLPEPTHRSYSARRAPGRIPPDEIGLRPWVSMADALGWTGTATPITCTHTQTNYGRKPRGQERPMDRPAQTLDCTAGRWTFEPPTDAPPSTPEWTEGRPSTTLVGSGRVAAPTARDRDPNWKPGDPWPSHFQNAIRITPEQAAVLMGFRPNYPWKGPRGKQFLQIGNAVCPPIARVVLAEAMRPTLEAEGRPR